MLRCIPGLQLFASEVERAFDVKYEFTDIIADDEMAQHQVDPAFQPASEAIEMENLIDTHTGAIDHELEDFLTRFHLPQEDVPGDWFGVADSSSTITGYQNGTPDAARHIGDEHLTGSGVSLFPEDMSFEWRSAASPGNVILNDPVAVFQAGL